jgi:hypothetical protein
LDDCDLKIRITYFGITMAFQASVNCIMMEIDDSCVVYKCSQDYIYKTIKAYLNSVHCYGIYCLNTGSDPQYMNPKLKIRNTGQAHTNHKNVCRAVCFRENYARSSYLVTGVS